MDYTGYQILELSTLSGSHLFGESGCSDQRFYNTHLQMADRAAACPTKISIYGVTPVKLDLSLNMLYEFANILEMQTRIQTVNCGFTLPYCDRFITTEGPEQMPQFNLFRRYDSVTLGSFGSYFKCETGYDLCCVLIGQTFESTCFKIRPTLQDCNEVSLEFFELQFYITTP